MEVPRVKLLGVVNDGSQNLRVYAVDAPYIRCHYPSGIEFFAGHHEVYPWIPDNEIWIDAAFPLQEAEFFTFDHELPEHWRMKIKKMLYAQAHELSNNLELAARRRGKPSGRFRPGGVL
jgi:hypothetical protein